MYDFSSDVLWVVGVARSIGFKTKTHPEGWV